MPLIKRYSNRKLYDTQAKRYVTLDDVAALIRAGEDVRVVDNETGDDLTDVTLAQVIFAEARHKAARLPRGVLSLLIRAGQTPVQAWSRQLQHTIDALVEEGELSESAADRLRSLPDPLEAGQRLWPDIAESRLQAALHRLNLPSHDDVQELRARLDELAEQLEELEERQDQQGTASSVMEPE
jgi:polyhydroxyalkanoate synthesis repressor PhaR